MARIGKRILSAFIEVTDNKKGSAPDRDNGPATDGSETRSSNGSPVEGSPLQADARFTDYFDKLFSEGNIPGPDYYEFSKMIGAMQAIPDEQSRFYAAYAGLHVQGLEKEKLLSTAAEYLHILSADASHFQATVDNALQEKVHGKAAAAEEKSQRIRSLSQEIIGLQQQIAALQAEILEDKGKIEASSTGYSAESQRRKTRIQDDIEKIRHYIH
jgi:hypothetical protein